jgi:hypothetical protein
MYKKVLVPVDLADTDLAKPAITTAIEMVRTSGGSVRLVNVLAMTPVMLAEYVPPDFDVQQRKSAEEALGIIAHECGLDAARVSATVRQGGATTKCSRKRRRSRGPDRDEFASSGDAHVLPRLQCRTRGALCQVFGSCCAPVAGNYWGGGMTPFGSASAR